MGNVHGAIDDAESEEMIEDLPLKSGMLNNPTIPLADSNLDQVIRNCKAFLVEQHDKYIMIREEDSAEVNYANRQWFSSLEIIFYQIEEMSSFDRFCDILDNLLGLINVLFHDSHYEAGIAMCDRLAEFLDISKPLLDYLAYRDGRPKLRLPAIIEVLRNVPKPRISDSSESMKTEFFIERGKCIGKGSFGSAYEGKLFGTDVIIKYGNNARGRSAHWSTKIIMGVIRHPLIVLFLAGFPRCKQEVFVMASKDFIDLVELQERRFKFGTQLFQFISAKICAGIMFLHRRGIIHFDIKPNNIIMNAQGEIRIIDFDLAEFCYGNFRSDLSPIYKSRTAAEERYSMRGNVLFRAPEFNRADDIGRAADWYSVGRTLDHVYSQNSILSIGHVPTLPRGKWCQLVSFIRTLLIAVPQKRLGSNSYEDIINADYFNGINWDTIDNELSSSGDLAHFPARSSQNKENRECERKLEYIIGDDSVDLKLHDVYMAPEIKNVMRKLSSGGNGPAMIQWQFSRVTDMKRLTEKNFIEHFKTLIYGKIEG